MPLETIHPETLPAADAVTVADTLPLVERLDPAPGAVEVFRQFARLPHMVFFDSAMRHPRLGRYSFIAADPVEWLEVPSDGSDGLALLESRFSSLPSNSHPNLPPFQGGWAGMFGYDLGRSLEQIPAAVIDEFQTPALAVGLYDVVMAFDHEQNAAWIISQGFPETEAKTRRERAATRLQHFKTLLQTTTLTSPCLRLSPTPTLAAGQLAKQHATHHFNLTSNFTRDDYCRTVRRVIDYIHAGDVFQVNLAQRLLRPANASSVELYCRLRVESPAPFASYFDAGAWQLASASPECFLRVNDGHVETRPIKGTRPRGASADEEVQATAELRDSAKDRAENVMIVDLLRNDLSRTCRPESVRVTQLCEVESYAAVHHLVSAVDARLAPDQTPLNLLRTCFPGGSVTGAPKVRAMEIIAELEPTARGAYCGALGYITANGKMDTSVLIRTITAARGWWQLPVGGGIVARSDPDAEYAETWHKAAALLRAMEARG